MDNKQLAHDLAVARMAGKQLPPDVLVDEYRKTYDAIFKYLQSEPKPQAHVTKIKL